MAINNIYTFKLNQMVSHNCDALRVEFDFKKDVGYVANVSLVAWNPGIIGFSLSTNVWIYPSISITIIPCTQQNAKMSAEAFKRFKINSRDYAIYFIKKYNLNEKGVKIVAFK